jgi:hypothetical protein
MSAPDKVSYLPRDHMMCIKVAIRSAFAVALLGMGFAMMTPARAINFILNSELVSS